MTLTFAKEIIADCDPTAAPRAERGIILAAKVLAIEVARLEKEIQQPRIDRGGVMPSHRRELADGGLSGSHRAAECLFVDASAN